MRLNKKFISATLSFTCMFLFKLKYKEAYIEHCKDAIVCIFNFLFNIYTINKSW